MKPKSESISGVFDDADADLNAALICAAPELYAALSEIIGILDADGNLDDFNPANARAALRKARGE